MLFIEAVLMWAATREHHHEDTWPPASLAKTVNTAGAAGLSYKEDAWRLHAAPTLVQSGHLLQPWPTSPASRRHMLSLSSGGA